MENLYIEIVTERVSPGPQGITASTLRAATVKDIRAAKKAHKSKYPHENAETTVVYDVSGWMYDTRKCGICNEFISLL